MKSEVKRIYTLDELRGFAILCMVVHHSFLDVGDVLGLSWGYTVFDALCLFQPIFWAIFIVISGICSRLSRNTIKRGFIVLAGGIAVTIVTAVIMPLLGFTGAEIYFGILHCLGCSMIITGLLMPIIKKIDYRIGAVICLILFFFTYGINAGTMCFGLIDLPQSWYQYDFLAPLGVFSSSFQSADYFSLIPWLFMFLFGSFLGKLALNGKFPEGMYKKHSKFLCLVGKNSLWIYLLHQPILYAIMFVIAVISAL
ncbi:MAG: DUF1624 domain-containing protein [Clostridiales bacterium]|nr:DUF1624 domain-containing protein [Clostridiales bacterium]